MRWVKAFCAGVAFPSALLPIFVFACLSIRNTDVLAAPFVVAIPALWGLWNIVYTQYLSSLFSYNEEQKYMIAGAFLGLIVAFLGVFVFDAEQAVGIEKAYSWIPFVLAPIAYAIIWRYVVKPLNELLFSS